MSTPDAPPSPQLVLASRSPRRQDLLRAAGYEFIVDPADVDEDNYPRDILPADLAQRLAKTKAQDVALRHPDAVVLAADTVVAFGDQVLGKPIDAVDARRMLTLLSGTTHIVITGVSLRRLASGLADDRRVMSAVRMRFMTDREISRYVESGQWEGKAGGYGIQDNDPFVKRMAGCHTNIVGLPMTTTTKMLTAAGIAPNASGKS